LGLLGPGGHAAELPPRYTPTARYTESLNHACIDEVEGAAQVSKL
jgi:hypothetical protein